MPLNLGNTKIYLHFLTFLDNEIAHAVDIPPCGRHGPIHHTQYTQYPTGEIFRKSITQRPSYVQHIIGNDLTSNNKNLFEGLRFHKQLYGLTKKIIRWNVNVVITYLIRWSLPYFSYLSDHQNVLQVTANVLGTFCKAWILWVMCPSLRYSSW